VDAEYEVWNVADGSCIGAHDSERAAMQAVAELVRRSGRQPPELRSRKLLGSQPGDQKRLISDGDDLVELALRTAAA